MSHARFAVDTSAHPERCRLFDNAAQAVESHPAGTLSPLEKVLALHGDLRVPLSAVEQVCPEPHPWRALRGIRAPGTGFPGLIAYGSYRYDGGQDFALILVGVPVVGIDLRPGGPFDRLLVSTRRPGEALAAIAAASV